LPQSVDNEAHSYYNIISFLCEDQASLGKSHTYKVVQNGHKTSLLSQF
jgi:hypothetical protein